jgi:hypothetical protein
MKHKNRYIQDIVTTFDDFVKNSTPKNGHTGIVMMTDSSMNGYVEGNVGTEENFTMMFARAFFDDEVLRRSAVVALSMVMSEVNTEDRNEIN